ncbi:permease-like cell division protein FtsX [Dyella ginsengisoli]|uniref:permease-like cell division protein FtsX n=1 Tax=Dyella ginsengisoli TaxID=363848 RepID=UPI00034D5D39|nr:permease-like cell division protein FtsX [Dyella ginsengisoli]
MSGRPDAPAEAAVRDAHSRRSETRRVGGWAEHHRWSAAASLRRLLGRPFGTLMTVTVIGLALALPLAFYLMLGNVQRMGDAMGQRQAVSVFLKPGQSEAVAQLLAKDIGERADVAGVVVKTPQQGMDELAAMQGFSGALHALDDNPLPYVLQVMPKDALDAGAVQDLVTALREQRGVDMVQDSGSWRQRLDALLGLGNRIVAVLALLLSLAAVLVVGNTVRVDIAGRVDEIGVLMLVGASRPFVRRPYLYAGIWYGLFGGVVASLVAVAIELSLVAPVERLSAAYAGKLSIGGLPLWLLLATPVAAALLGWVGARLVSAWQLRRVA